MAVRGNFQVVDNLGVEDPGAEAEEAGCASFAGSVDGCKALVADRGAEEEEAIARKVEDQHR